MNKIVVSVLVILLVGGGLLGVFFYSNYTAPVQALQETVDDIKASGLEGLRPHLTDRNAETLDQVLTVADNQYIGYVGKILQKDSKVLPTLIDKLDEIDWTLGKIERKGDNATVSVQFVYAPSVSGTIDITMVRTETDRMWKIDAFYLADISWRTQEQVNS